MKKRAIILAAALALSMVLTACRAVDRDNQFEMPSEDLATLGQTKPTEAQTGTNPAQDGRESLSVPYQYGNIQKDMPSFMNYGDKAIFWYFVDGEYLLYTVDKSTLEIELLCQDASCGHHKPKCISYNKSTGMEQYEGKFYGIEGVIDGKIVKLDGRTFKQISQGNVESFVHSNGELYAITSDSALVKLKKNGATDRVLLDDFPGCLPVAKESILYAVVGENVVQVDLSAEEPRSRVVLKGAYPIFDLEAGRFYYFDTNDFCLYECDETFQNKKKITECNTPYNTINFDDDYVYYHLQRGEFWGDDCGDLYRMKKDEPGDAEKFAVIPEGAVGMVLVVPDCNYIFVQALRKTEVEGTRDFIYYAVSKDGSEIVKLEIPEI